MTVPIPIPVLEALQEHIDRTEAEWYSKIANDAEASNAFAAAKKLGMLQEYINAQKRGENE